MMRRWMIFAGALLCVSAKAQPLPEQDIPALLKQRIADSQGKAIVVGIIDAQGQRFYSEGPADPATGKRADQHTLFALGSVTKLFTSLLLADMALKGEVGIDDPVQLHLPSGVTMARSDTPPITLADLAMHRSGLPREMPRTAPRLTASTAPGTPVEAVYRFVASTPPERAPGKVEYSNLGVSLLGHALAHRAGHSYANLIEERIARPLGMDNTVVTLTPALRARVAQGHMGPVIHPHTEVAPASWPSGGVYSSASDMLKFLGAAFLLPRSSLEAAMDKMRRPYSDKPDLRLAWGVGRGNGSEFWTHSGRIYGYTSTMTFDTRGKRGVVLLSNNSGTVLTDLSFHILNKTFKPRQIVPPPAFVRMVEDSDFRQVTGAYRALRHRDPSFFLEEYCANEWGGMLIEKRRFRQAVAVMKFNAERYPKSANAHDSLGLALEANGERSEAVAAYRRALELDPMMGSARERLKALGVAQ